MNRRRSGKNIIMNRYPRSKLSGNQLMNNYSSSSIKKPRKSGKRMKR